jgi:hypothetical protein
MGWILMQPDNSKASILMQPDNSEASIVALALLHSDCICTFDLTLKISITSSPCHARYDSSLPCFLKTDWADGTGMGWILMQPDNSEASIVALALLHFDCICPFDLTMNGARLRPIAQSILFLSQKEVLTRMHHP